MKKPSRHAHKHTRNKGKPDRASKTGLNTRPKRGPGPGPNRDRGLDQKSEQSTQSRTRPNQNEARGKDQSDTREKDSRAAHRHGDDQHESRGKDRREYTRQEGGKKQRGAPGKAQGKGVHGPRRKPRMPREVSILFEDDALIVVNKPAGLLAVPIKGSDVPSALSLLIAELKPRKQRALIVHRIDRFASGILLFAKTDRDRDSLIHQFLAHSPVRGYLAVVRGQLREATGPLIHYFKRLGLFQQLRTAKDADAARAELRYYIDRVFRDATLIKVELVTGLQNQIRAQFSALGHPIIGDRKYEPKEAEEHLIDRVALHAAHLEFTHPRTGETIKLDCPPPQDFQRLIRGLEHSSRSR
jgi:23S rRNA pseudouridine1911/1915/1917 synthase